MPDLSGRALPMVCAPLRATISWSEKPMRWNTLRRWEAAQSVPSGKGAAAAAEGGHDLAQVRSLGAWSCCMHSAG